MIIWTDVLIILFPAAVAFCAGFTVACYLWWTGKFVKRETDPPVKLVGPDGK